MPNLLCYCALCLQTQRWGKPLPAEYLVVFCFGAHHWHALIQTVGQLGQAGHAIRQESPFQLLRKLLVRSKANPLVQLHALKVVVEPRLLLSLQKLIPCLRCCEICGILAVSRNERIKQTNRKDNYGICIVYVCMYYIICVQPKKPSFVCQEQRISWPGLLLYRSNHQNKFGELVEPAKSQL